MANSSAFTLVEIIVTVTILSLLSVAGLWAYASSAESARDASRTERLAKLASVLGSHRTEIWFFPVPDGAVPIMCHGFEVWKQGTFWELAAAVTGIGSPPKDPLIANAQFSYSLTASWSQYEIASLLEGDSYEQWWLYRTRALVVGNYNRIALPCDRQPAGGFRLVAVPSITLSRLGAYDLSSGFPDDAFVVDGFENVPASYAGKAYWTSSVYRFAPPVSAVFATGASAAQVAAFSSSAYSGTEFASAGLWRKVAEAGASSPAAADLGSSLLAGFSGWGASGWRAWISCADLPQWANARFVPGSPQSSSQPWQNGNSMAACYYECLSNWRGEACATKDAVCGSRHWSVVAALSGSDSGLCSWDSGSLLPGSFSEAAWWFSWTCAGLAGGNTANCAATKP